MTEFSFEEIRAIKYRRKRAEEEMKQIEEEKQRWKEEQAQALKRQVIDFCICIERGTLGCSTFLVRLMFCSTLIMFDN